LPLLKLVGLAVQNGVACIFFVKSKSASYVQGSTCQPRYRCKADMPSQVEIATMWQSVLAAL